VIDLHTHTIFSDGTTTPEENAALAAQAGLAGLALTDHDTMDGWPRMAAACQAHHLLFVPGIEFSSELAGQSVHLLGYGIDPDHPPLRDECIRLRGERERRGRIMVERLVASGAPITWDRVAELAGRAPIGRPHMAAALIEAGVVADIDAAFAGPLADDSAIYEPKQALMPEAAIRLLVEAGGVVVLAHPGLTFPDLEAFRGILQGLITAGLAGLECDHPGHDAQTQIGWEQLAGEFGLLSTGASDFHGEAKQVRIGARATSPEVVNALRERSTGGVRWQVQRND